MITESAAASVPTENMLFSSPYRSKIKPKILLVDDRHENLVALKQVLSELDVELIEASSGNAALQHTLHHNFALALLDVQMPDMDGYELAEIMRGEASTAYIPIIFISAIYTDKLNVFKGYEQGAFSFITKPFEPVELLNKVKFFISKYHTEQGFIDSRKKYMDLYNSSPDMLASIDMSNMNIVECNQTLLAQTGFTREELINQPFTNLYDKKSSEVVKRLFRDYLKDGSVSNVELTLVTKSGEEINVLFNCNGITDLDGKLIYSNSSLRNISELKEAREKLEHALDDVRKKNEELENLVYITSHDLQEPMITVLSSVSLIEERLASNLDNDSRKYVEYSKTAANRMRGLLTSLMDYLRIGKQKEVEIVEVSELLDEVIHHLQSIYSIDADFGTIPSSLKIMGRREELFLLFKNLVDNALKFRKPEEKPRVRFNVRPEQEHYTFSVTDNGIGISKSQQKKAFKIFGQLHDRGKYPGTGMGLALSKKIVESMGGSIWLKSEENNGTMVEFTVPLRKLITSLPR